MFFSMEMEMVAGGLLVLWLKKGNVVQSVN